MQLDAATRQEITQIVRDAFASYPRPEMVSRESPPKVTPGAVHSLTSVESVRIEILGAGKAVTIPASKILEWQEQEQQRVDRACAAMFATTAEDVARELRQDAGNEVLALQRWAGEIWNALESHKHGAFDRGWITRLQEYVQTIANLIDRANGATLVRGTFQTPAETPAKESPTKEST